MKLPEDLREFIELLNDHGVEYVLVGGWAFGYHAIPRYTGDLDFFVRCDQLNSDRLTSVLHDFGMNDLSGFEESFLDPDRIIQFGVPPNRIDILTKIDGVTFDEVWNTRVQGMLEKVEVPLISRDLLIRNKTAAARPKDLADVDVLKKTQRPAAD